MPPGRPFRPINFMHHVNPPKTPLKTRLKAGVVAALKRIPLPKRNAQPSVVHNSGGGAPQPAIQPNSNLRPNILRRTINRFRTSKRNAPQSSTNSATGTTSTASNTGATTTNTAHSASSQSSSQSSTHVNPATSTTSSSTHNTNPTTTNINAHSNTNTQTRKPTSNNTSNSSNTVKKETTEKETNSKKEDKTTPKEEKKKTDIIKTLTPIRKWGARGIIVLLIAIIAIALFRASNVNTPTGVQPVSLTPVIGGAVQSTSFFGKVLGAFVGLNPIVIILVLAALFLLFPRK